MTRRSHRVALAEKTSTPFSPGPIRTSIILLYGPDSGLVRERAEALLASAVDDPNDPFRWSGWTATNSRPSRRGWSMKP